MNYVFQRAARLTLVILFSLAASAFSIPLEYEIGNASGVSANSGSGLLINTALDSGLAGQLFTLDDGQSSTFSFFDIWTNETSVNPDDRIPRPITATLDFTDPSTGAIVNGVTFGGSLLFFEGGRVQWTSPALVSVAVRLFTVSLSDETFNVGLFGLNRGPAHGASVRATVSQISSSPSLTPAAPRRCWDLRS